MNEPSLNQTNPADRKPALNKSKTSAEYNRERQPPDRDTYQPLGETSTVPSSHVLVIVTGGTIAMANKNGQYVLERNYINKVIKRSSILHDIEFSKSLSFTEQHNNCFVLPKSMLKEKRVFYQTHECEVFTSSSSMTSHDYGRIAQDIHENYECFDGFVILHGTDTMAYTASFLSFMLENLEKPVVLTGAQVPLCEIRSDGVDNLLSSLLIAGNYTIPEVTLFFHHRLYRGNRCIKIDCEGFQAFDSPNYSPLLEMGVNIKVHWDLIRKSSIPNNFFIQTEMQQNVVLLRLFPGITTSTIDAFLGPPVAGVVLQTYGAGNVPSIREDILNCFTNASKRGVLIVNCTQCLRGSVVVSYENEKIMEDAGILPGHDMTSECALAKLSYLLGRNDITYTEKRVFLTGNTRGELTKPK